MASNGNNEISFFEARELMKTIAEECSAKEELAQDIHRRIYTIDMALASDREKKTRLEKTLELNRIRPTLSEFEAAQASRAFGSIIARINDLHHEVEKAYREMFLEYRKISEMRKIYATYASMTERYEKENPK